jgi:hypothetical protein
MISPKRSGGTLAMHAAGAGGTVNAMLLNLGDVMAHVIDDIQPAIPAVLLAKYLAQPLSQSRAVGEGVVTGSLHCIKVCRPLTAVNWGGCKLAVREADTPFFRVPDIAISAIIRLYRSHMLGADLMPEPSGSGVNHGRHLSLSEAEGRGSVLVDHPVYYL